MAQSLYEENQQIEKNVNNLDLKTMICKKETKQLMTEEVAGCSTTQHNTTQHNIVSGIPKIM